MGVSKVNKLKDLIHELCPNGVEYKKLADCCVLEKGNTPIQKAIPGEFPLVVTTEERKSCNTYQFDKPTVCIPLVSSRGHGVASLNSLYYQEGKFALGNILCGVTPVNSDELSAKFLFYYLNHKKDTLIVPLMRGGANVSLTVDSLKRVKVPVPPISVQREIVRIFDKFESLGNNLGLELIARKKQYEHYADYLFVSDIPPNEWMAVGEIIISLKTGLNPRQNFKLNVGGDKPYITGKDIYNNSINVSDKTDLITDDVVLLINRRACLATNDVLFASTGTGTVGRMAVVDNYDNTWAVSETMFCLKLKVDVINPYYLMYALYTQSAKRQFEPKISKGSVPHLKVKDLLDVKIPVPNLTEQERVVDLVRKFDALCNNVSTGLPAEIEMRQKQYAYYRDKLLTFKQIP